MPLPFAVCATLTSDPEHPRLDTFFSEQGQARDRRREIVREGWVRFDEEDP